MFRHLLFIFCSLFVTHGVASSICTRPLTVGYEDWPPYQYEKTTRHGKLTTGLDVEMLEAIMGELGCSIKWVRMPWVQHLKALKSGEVDLAMAASYSLERSQFAYYTEGYRDEIIALFVQRDKREAYPAKSLRELFRGPFKFKLGIEQGFIYGGELESLRTDPKYKDRVITATLLQDNIKDLAEKTIDGFLGDPIAVWYALRDTSYETQVVKHPMSVYSNQVHILLSKASMNSDMAENFNKALIRLQEKGVYQTILKAYVPQ